MEDFSRNERTRVLDDLHSKVGETPSSGADKGKKEVEASAKRERASELVIGNLVFRKNLYVG